MGWVKEVRGPNKEDKKQNKQTKTLLATGNSVVTTRGKGKWREVEESEGQINGDGRRLDLGW